MERSASGHDTSDEEDRKSRFQSPIGSENGVTSPRERAASQPARPIDNGIQFSSPPTQFLPSSLGGPWNNSSRILSPNRGQPVPIRSSSFSSQPQNPLTTTMRERRFPSTFEDDESEADTYDEQFVPPSLSRGRTYGQDPSRSRSQSLATSRPGLVGSPYTGSSAMQSWNESYLQHSNPLSIPASGSQRYGEIKPPGQSRYGSLGTIGRSPTNIHSSSPSGGSFVGNGYINRNQQVDVSNMSPFVRDVGQILLDDGSAFRELWAGMHPPKDENGGGGSGTTSRRHSVSVVQPRRGNVVGFNAPGADDEDDLPRPFQSSYGGRSGLLLSDDDLACDLGVLSINPSEHPRSSSSQHPPSQPSSLPIYAPLSRSPASRELMSTYQSIIPSGNTYSRQTIGTPSEGDYSTSGTSPSRASLYEQHITETQFSPRITQQQQPQQQHEELTARFIPGQGIQYVHPQQQQQLHQHHGNDSQYVRNRAPSYTGSISMQSPISPGTRAINPQQPPYYPQTQRRLSDAQRHHQQPPTPTSAHHPPNLSELGKGVPLSAVPSSWPLFIVEFKAGRTDLFYLTDLSQDIRIGDFVIVEADRGKDLGKVVNDSITLAEVEEFQRQQLERGFGGGGGMDGNGQPTSPGGSAAPGGKKEINPKMMYKKATQQDLQCVYYSYFL
jgi:hypothetical protein